MIHRSGLVFHDTKSVHNLDWIRQLQQGLPTFRQLDAHERVYGEFLFNGRWHAYDASLVLLFFYQNVQKGSYGIVIRFNLFGELSSIKG